MLPRTAIKLVLSVRRQVSSAIRGEMIHERTTFQLGHLQITFTALHTKTTSARITFIILASALEQTPSIDPLDMHFKRARRTSFFYPSRMMIVQSVLESRLPDSHSHSSLSFNFHLLLSPSLFRFLYLFVPERQV